LREVALEQRQSEIRKLARKQTLLPFDLGRGPLLRCSLLHLSDEQSLLLLTLHRLIADDWSVSLFVRDLARLYEASTQGQASPLAPVADQYANFVRSHEQPEAALAEHLAYWQKQVADAPPVLPLPADRSRPAVISWSGAS